MRYIKFVSVAMALFVAVAPLAAQEYKQVEVTKNYMHEVAPAKKIVAPTDITETPVIEPTITYNVSPESWQIELEDHNFRAATPNYWDLNRPEHLFARVASGYPLITDATLRYTTHNVRLGYFGVGFDHKANFAQRTNSFGNELSMADSYSMSNVINVGGGAVLGRQMLEASLDYGCDIANRYAKQSPDRLYFHDGNLRVRYGDDFVNLSRVNFAVEAEGSYWSHHVPTGEDNLRIGQYNAALGIELARDFRGNVVGFKAGFGIWQGDKQTNYRDIAANVGVSYARSFGIISLRAEVGYMYDRVAGREKASHFIMPAARLDFDFGLVEVQPYIEVETNIKHNGVEALYKSNMFVDFAPMQQAFNTMASTRSYDLHFGIVGSDKSSKVAYRVYLGSSFIRDQMFWYVNEVGTFGFAQGDNTRLFAGAEVEYHPIGGLRLAAAARGHLDGTSSVYAASDAKLTANLLAEYRLKSWTFGLSCDFIGRRVWSGSTFVDGKSLVAFEAPANFDLHADISCRVTSAVEIFVSGSNLLNQKIFDQAYYYRNGIGCMVGAKIDF